LPPPSVPAGRSANCRGQRGPCGVAAGAGTSGFQRRRRSRQLGIL